MHFKLGEKVSFLHESGWGIIRAFEKESVVVEDETGFERLVLLGEMVKIHGSHGDHMDTVPVSLSGKEAENDIGHQSKRLDDVRKLKDFWEIDLHSHELLESEIGMSNAEVLRHQMSVFKSFFRGASDKQVRKLVVIHGVGQGVLKGEIRDFLSQQDGVQFYDADFNEYGKGATTIELLYR